MSEFEIYNLIVAIGVLVIYLAAAIAVGAYAGRIGRNAPSWLLLACVSTPPVAFFMAALFGPIASGCLKKCPMCAETVKQEALLCRFCRSAFTQPEVAQEEK